MELLRVTGLSSDALTAAAEFHAEWLARARALAGTTDLTLVFAPADHTHTGWRLGALQGLAREAVPQRVNAIASDDSAAIAAALDFLTGAAGVTGQYLPLDSAGAGAVITSAS